MNPIKKDVTMRKFEGMAAAYEAKFARDKA